MKTSLPHRALALGMTAAVALGAAQAGAEQPQGAGEEMGAPSTPAPSDESVDYQLYGGIAGLGVAAGFAALGIYATVRTNAIIDDDQLDQYRSLIPSNRNACEAARNGEQVSDTGQPDPSYVADLCDEARTLETVQAISIPLSVLAGMASIVLVGSSDAVCGAGQQAMRITPWLGPEGGGVGVRARF